MPVREQETVFALCVLSKLCPSSFQLINSQHHERQYCWLSCRIWKQLTCVVWLEAIRRIIFDVSVIVFWLFIVHSYVFDLVCYVILKLFVNFFFLVLLQTKLEERTVGLWNLSSQSKLLIQFYWIKVLFSALLDVIFHFTDLQ